jgi:hypothetical protein
MKEAGFFWANLEERQKFGPVELSTRQMLLIDIGDDICSKNGEKK